MSISKEQFFFVHSRHKRLEKLISMNAPEVIILSELKLLKMAVDNILKDKKMSKLITGSITKQVDK